MRRVESNDTCCEHATANSAVNDDVNNQIRRADAAARTGTGDHIDPAPSIGDVTRPAQAAGGIVRAASTGNPAAQGQSRSAAAIRTLTRAAPGSSPRPRCPFTACHLADCEAVEIQAGEGQKIAHRLGVSPAMLYRHILAARAAIFPGARWQRESIGHEDACLPRCAAWRSSE